MNNVEIVFKKNIDIVLNDIASATKEAAEKMAVIVRDSVQYQMLYGYKDPHGKDGHTEIVETGALFDSIEGKVKNVTRYKYAVEVGTDKDYAKYVHDGTRKLKPRRFMRDGIIKAQADLVKTVKESLKNA